MDYRTNNSEDVDSQGVYDAFERAVLTRQMEKSIINLPKNAAITAEKKEPLMEIHYMIKEVSFNTSKVYLTATEPTLFDRNILGIHFDRITDVLVSETDVELVVKSLSSHEEPISLKFERVDPYLIHLLKNIKRSNRLRELINFHSHNMKILLAEDTTSTTASIFQIKGDQAIKYDFPKGDVDDIATIIPYGSNKFIVKTLKYVAHSNHEVESTSLYLLSGDGIVEKMKYYEIIDKDGAEFLEPIAIDGQIKSIKFLETTTQSSFRLDIDIVKDQDSSDIFEAKAIILGGKIVLI